MHGLHRALSIAIPFLQQMHKPVLVQRNLVVLAHLHHDLIKHLFVGRAQFHFHVNAAQECGVHERTGIKIGRKHDQLAEWNLQRMTGLQPQEIDPGLQRHDPAVEQLLRADRLAAKVVDEEHAAVRF